jgi:RND family efflux transporter MFP subunit
MPSIRFVAILPIMLALAGCGGEDPKEVETASSLLAVSLVQATTRSLQHSVVASGPVSAYEEMQLGVEISGVRVTALNVDVGQWVKRDQVLLTLDHRTLDSELNQAQASLREAEAGTALATSNYNRSSVLAKQQLISASALDGLHAARVQAEAQQATARAARDAAQLRRDFAELRAPAAGLVSKRFVQPGQVVTAGTELLRMIRDGRLEWRAELPEAELAVVATGSVVRLPYAGKIVEGRIRAVTPGVDSQTRTGTIHADLPEPGPLKSGTYVEGRIVTGEGPALTVPAAAVVQRDGHAYVFTVDVKHVAHRVRVRTGTSTGGAIEILDGLKPGAHVVLQGAGFLGDGDSVRVVDATVDAAATR